MGCDVILVDVRQLEKNFNAQVGAQNRRDLAFCRESAQQASCTNGSTLTYSFNDRLLVLPTTDQSSGCHTHADCPYDHFCGMMVTGSACQTNSLCMPCFWCEGCHPNTSASPAYWYLTPVEPTCGHCPCAEECSPGCSVSMLENDHCDAACFTRTCDYDNHQCPYPSPEETSEELAPALQPCDADATQVVRTANTGAARYNVEASLAQGCCAPFTQSSATDESETRTLQVVVSHFAGFDDFPGIEQVPFGWQNKVSQDSFEYWRLLNNRNRVLGGVVMKTFRHDFTACGDGVFRKFVGSCHEATSSTELSSAYSADGVFQIGNPFYDPVIAKDQHVHYPDPADLNKYGVPYGFRAHQMKDGTVAYPVVLDCNLDSERAFELVDFLQACDYFDTRSTSFTLQLLTYKVQDERFTQGMRTRWHVNTRDMLLMYMQLILGPVTQGLCMGRDLLLQGTDLLNFVGLLITIVVMYAMMGHIIFGGTMASFSKFTFSLRTCFVMMMGDTDFNDRLYALDEGYETVALGLMSRHESLKAVDIKWGIDALAMYDEHPHFFPTVLMMKTSYRSADEDDINYIMQTRWAALLTTDHFRTIFFVTFMILVFVFLLSAFLGIIVSAMEEVKAQNAGEKKNNLFSDIARLTAFYAKSAACATQRFLDRYGLRHSRGSSAISESLLYEQLQSWQAHMAGSQGRHRVAPRSELMEMWQAWRTHGSVMDGIEVFNWAFLFFFVIAHTIYLQLLISMDRFDMSVRYHIYESLSGHDGSGHHVNWLQLHNDGEDLSEFEQKLQEFSELLALKSEYQLFTALTIIAALIKVLKLMDFHPDIGMEIERELREVAQTYGLDVLLQRRKLGRSLSDSNVADCTAEEDVRIHLAQDDALL
eukprot:gene7797-9264_t